MKTLWNLATEVGDPLGILNATKEVGLNLQFKDQLTQDQQTRIIETYLALKKESA